MNDIRNNTCVARMDGQGRNLLYDYPELYDQVYPEPNEETPTMCRRMFEEFLPRLPVSLLDIGCGTGRNLECFTRDYPDCLGIDHSPKTLDYVREKRPHLRVQVGDMRELQLGRTFDAIICLGWTFMHALSNADVNRTLATFDAHAHAGTLLILDCLNGSSCLYGGSFKVYEKKQYDTMDDPFQAEIIHCFDRRQQVLIRKRTWHLPGQPPVDDYSEYRIIFPADLEERLAGHGWRVVGMFDNLELEQSDFSGVHL